MHYLYFNKIINKTYFIDNSLCGGKLFRMSVRESFFRTYPAENGNKSERGNETLRITGA